MKKIIPFLLLFLCFLLAGCASEGTEQQRKESEQLDVYTTVYPLQYFTEEIGRDYVHVESIYPPGSDEHTFEPSQKDMMKLADADLFIYIGLGLEGFVQKAQKALKNEQVNLLAAGENIDSANLNSSNESEDAHEHEHTHGDFDPHVWIDPILAKDLALSIKEELVQQLPNHEEELQTNYNDLVQRLNELNTQFESLSKEAKHKDIIVSHAAYGYWEKRYGIHQLSVTGLSSTNEPTQKQLKTIVNTARELDLQHIFFEQNISSNLTKIVQKEMHAEPLYLHNLSVLTDEDIVKKRTYFSIMEDNLTALKKALIHSY